MSTLGVVLALAEINEVNFHATKWQRCLLTIGVAAVVSAFNALAATHLSVAEGVFALCHVYALVPIVVSLWVLAPKRSATDVFLHFTDNGGDWPTIQLSVLVGQLPSIFTWLGSEATSHIAEEIEEPDTVLPRCMVWSYFINAPGTLLVLLTYAFNISNLDEVMSDVVPLVSLLRSAFLSKEVTTGLVTVLLLLVFMVAISTMVLTSRHLFAFGSVLTIHVRRSFAD